MMGGLLRAIGRPAALGILLLAGCRITPEEIQSIEVENELLRKEIQTIRENCEYYKRQLELEVEEKAPSGRD
jgi:hypothetical protein